MPLTVGQGLLLDKTSKQIIREVKDRLIERGHKVTGELENSFEPIQGYKYGLTITFTT